MKTSNIILASLLGSITVTTMAMMIDIGFGGGSPEYTQYDQKDIQLPPLRHLKVHNAPRSVSVEVSASGAIRLFTIKGNQMPSITYHMNGDTLVIDQFDNHDLVGAYFTLQVPGNELHDIYALNTEVVLNDYPFERMSLHLDDATVQVYPKIRENLIVLSVDGSNGSHVNIGSHVDTLSLKLNRSSIRIDDTIQVLQGTITNSSSVAVREVSNFDFTKDESSRLDHWD